MTDIKSIPAIAERSTIDQDPPTSIEPDFQCLYEMFIYGKCGETHNILDLCPAASDHVVCGKKHSFVVYCHGTWKSLERQKQIAGDFLKLNKHKV